MIDLPLAVESQALSLFRGWATHFRAHDLALKYTHVETAHFTKINDGLILAGIVDAEGSDWIGEWKTSSPRDRKTWKRNWLLSTQALTYGLLTGGEKKYLVRKAFKTATPEYDHEWFEFDPRDLEMWERQVALIGHEISTYHAGQAGGHGPIEAPWPMNLEHGCFAYGPSYPCPFWQVGCSKNNFDGDVPHAKLIDSDEFGEFQGPNRDRLMELKAENPRALVLTATRIKNWQRCREMYRRLNRQSFEPSEAMLIGSRFHELVAAYNRHFVEGGV